MWLYIHVFLSYLQREETFVSLILFASYDERAFLKRSNFSWKEFAPKGANSFLEELIRIVKGGQNENDRVAFLESVPINLNMYTNSD